MRSLLLVICTGCLLTSCATSPPDAESDSAAPLTNQSSPEQSADQSESPKSDQAQSARLKLESGDFVLIYTDAYLRESLADDGRSHRAYEWTRDRASREFQPLLSAHVVEDHGEFVEVRTRRPDDPPMVCSARPILLGMGVSLRFFVARDDLAPTVTRPVEHTFEDGTGFELRPGVPLQRVEDDPGMYRTWHSNIALTVPLAEDVVGDAFSEYTPLETRLEVPAHVPAKAGWSLNGQEITFKKPGGDGDIVEVNEVSRRDETVLATLDRSCLRVTTAVAEAHDPPEPSGETGRLHGKGMMGTKTKSYYQAVEGATVYWPHGEPAGQTTRGHRFDVDDVGDMELVCRTRPLLRRLSGDSVAPPEQSEVEFCFKRDDLELVDQSDTQP